MTATNFAFVSPAAGGVVAFWLTLCMHGWVATMMIQKSTCSHVLKNETLWYHISCCPESDPRMPQELARREMEERKMAREEARIKKEEARREKEERKRKREAEAPFADYGKEASRWRAQVMSSLSPPGRGLRFLCRCRAPQFFPVRLSTALIRQLGF